MSLPPLAPGQRPAVIAIDGPVGAGKSSVARAVARRLQFRHLDTGAMYRAVALKYLRLAEAERTPERAVAIAAALNLDWRHDGTLFLDGEDITLAIRREEVSAHVHLAADNIDVRRALVTEQRRLGLEVPSVLEGRDIGTVVFPDARWKFYLDASPLERARRRALQLSARGEAGDLDAILARLLDRDARDRARGWGALRRAPDATLVDSSELGEDAVVQLMCAVVRAR